MKIDIIIVSFVLLGFVSFGKWDFYLFLHRNSDSGNAGFQRRGCESPGQEPQAKVYILLTFSASFVAMASFSSALAKFKPSSRVRLVYFDVRAKTEPILFLCAYKACEVEQLNVANFFGCSWPDAKATAPFGQLPLLILDDGQMLAQSAAIIRYIATQLDMVPKDPLKAAFVDQTLNAAEELNSINPLVNVFKDETFIAKKEDFFTGSNKGLVKIANLSKSLGDKSFFPGYVQFTMIYANEFSFDLKLFLPLPPALSMNPSASDSEPSYADFVMLHYLQMVLLIDSTAFDNYPNLQVCIHSVANLAKQYFRPLPFFVNHSIITYYGALSNADPFCRYFFRFRILQAYLARMGALPGVAEYMKTRPEAVGIGTQPMLKPVV
jgi:glutathione S-transferase